MTARHEPQYESHYVAQSNQPINQRQMFEMFQAFMAQQQLGPPQSMTQGGLSNKFLRPPNPNKYSECANCGRRRHTKQECWEQGGGRVGQKPSLDTI